MEVSVKSVVLASGVKDLPFVQIRYILAYNTLWGEFEISIPKDNYSPFAMKFQNCKRGDIIMCSCRQLGQGPDMCCYDIDEFVTLEQIKNNFATQQYGKQR